MDAAFIVVQGLTGLASAAALFIVASGLTIVFGVTRIVNFAHGSLTMLGAYLAATIAPRLMDAGLAGAGFWLAILIAATAVGLFGVALEVLLLRRIYRAPELYQLLATFGVVLVVQDLVVAAFGPEDILGPRAPGLTAPVRILGQRFSPYDLALIAAGAVVLGGLVWLLRRTRFGILARAATQDRDMVGALGVNQALLFTSTLFVGSFLAGLGGALLIPKVPAHAGMDLSIIAECFVVTVAGGMGSVFGAFLAALLIGQLQAFGILVFPKITLVLVFLVMALVLVWRPQGLLGRPELPAGPIASGALSPRLWTRAERWTLFVALACLAALPLARDPYLLTVASEVLIFALFAASLHVLIGLGALVSFGHAAYFGLGGYAAALALTKGGLPMEAALLLAPLAAATGAAVFGIFLVRLSGIYLAMLTLAAAQILYAVAVQWTDLTGGDNGIVGVWPSAWAASRAVYFEMTLLMVAAALAALHHLAFSPFGYMLRATRDSEIRARAIGLDVRLHRWLAFVIAGATAGLAGGLYAFLKGSVDPALLAIPTSVDALTMLLLGGVRTLLGPLVGAAVLHQLKDWVMPLTELWRMTLGIGIIAMVVLAPEGLVGTVERWRARLRRSRPSPPSPAGAAP